jgi:hypothetical protein
VRKREGNALEDVPLVRDVLHSDGIDVYVMKEVFSTRFGLRECPRSLTGTEDGKDLGGATPDHHATTGFRCVYQYTDFKRH